MLLLAALPALAEDRPSAGVEESPRLLEDPGILSFNYRHPAQEVVLHLDWPGGDVEMLEAVSESPWIRIDAEEGFSRATSDRMLNLHVRLLLDQLAPGVHTGQVAVLYPVDHALKRLEIPLTVSRSLPVVASPAVLQVLESGRPLSPALALYSLDREPLDVRSVTAPPWLEVTPVANGPAVRVAYTLAPREDAGAAELAAETNLVFDIRHPQVSRVEVPIRLLREIDLLRNQEARRRNVPVSALADWMPPPDAEE